LNVDDSSLPVTLFNFRMENASAATVELELTGTLENAVCREPGWWSGVRCNRVIGHEDLTLLQASVRPAVERTRVGRRSL
jgi:hypothetical protein